MREKVNLYLKISSWVFVIAFLIIYSYIEARDLISGPSIEITYPADGELISNQILTITGEAKNISNLSMNNRPIFTNESGKFQEKLILNDGYNIIEFTASDRFNKKVSKKLELVFKQNQNK